MTDTKRIYKNNQMNNEKSTVTGRSNSVSDKKKKTENRYSYTIDTETTYVINYKAI